MYLWKQPDALGIQVGRVGGLGVRAWERPIRVLTLFRRQSSKSPAARDFMASWSVLNGATTSWLVPQWRTTLAGCFPKNVRLSATFLWECVHGPETGLPNSSLQLSLPNWGHLSVIFWEFFFKRNLKRRVDEIETEFESNLIWLDLALLTGALTEGQFPKLYFPLKYLKAPFKIEMLCSRLLPRLFMLVPTLDAPWSPVFYISLFLSCWQ